jgi:nicotinamide mononucleotide (NMN) deamidase PncC
MAGSDELNTLTDSISRTLRGSGRTVAFAESLTSGALACQLGPGHLVPGIDVTDDPLL